MIKKLFIAICLGLSFVSGCGVTPLMGLNGIVDLCIIWKDGLATKYYTGNEETLYNHMKTVLNNLDQTIVKDRLDRKHRHEIITKSQHHKFHIYVYSYDRHIVKVCIRLDIMGDKEYAELIYSKLDDLMHVKTTKIIVED